MAETQKGINTAGLREQLSPTGINHLLVIAIDAYEHCPPLHNCINDAEQLIDVLTKNYRFDPEHVTRLFNGDATRKNILQHLKNLREKVAPTDNLILYFSGHGEMDGPLGFWVPVEALPANDDEFVSTADIKYRLDAINSFHTFLIADACFAGALFTTYRSVRPGYENKRSRWGLAASHSREMALDGHPGENSPFANCLIKNLKDNQVDIGAQRLAAGVIDEMSRAAWRTRK